MSQNTPPQINTDNNENVTVINLKDKDKEIKYNETKNTKKQFRTENPFSSDRNDNLLFDGCPINFEL